MISIVTVAILHPERLRGNWESRGELVHIRLLTAGDVATAMPGQGRVDSLPGCAKK